MREQGIDRACSPRLPLAFGPADTFQTSALRHANMRPCSALMGTGGRLCVGKCAGGRCYVGQCLSGRAVFSGALVDASLHWAVRWWAVH